MDFSKASLAELRQFTKDNGIKGCSGMKKAELAQFLIKYVEEHVTAVSVENKKNVSEPKTEHVVRETAGDTEYRKTRIVHHSEGSRGDDSRENNLKKETEIQSDYYLNDSNEYTVSCVINDRNEPLLDIKFSVPTQAVAVAICDNWRQKSTEIYDILVKQLWASNTSS